eukprot:scaffold73182_cov33-Phaeocystis_antarctica.AAC.1
MARLAAGSTFEDPAPLSTHPPPSLPPGPPFPPLPPCRATSQGLGRAAAAPPPRAVLPTRTASRAAPRPPATSSLSAAATSPHVSTAAWLASLVSPLRTCQGE